MRSPAICLGLLLGALAAAPADAASASPALISFDVRVRAGATAALTAPGLRIALTPGRHHVEIMRRARGVLVAVDGGRARVARRAPVVTGRATVRHRLATGAALEDRLTHRLAALRATARPGLPVMGSDRRGRVRRTRGWMAGFWPGALWRASDRRPRPFRSWALAATRALAGGERADTHDLGFIYGHSALAGWWRLCEDADRPVCPALERSAVRAAATLAEMIRRSPAGLLPTAWTRCRDCPPGHRETIVDSLQNLELLVWAAEHTGRDEWRRLAAGHAHAIVALLVRPDGSTAQAITFDRRTGELGEIHTHQGLRADTTWARGQAWALHGAATLAAALDDPALHAAAERLAAYAHGRLPDGRLPRWDYDARSGPTDASAAAVTAAGLARLAALDDALGRHADAARHRALARGLLDRIDHEVRRRPPIGRFAGQVYSYGGPNWDENAEFLLGIEYALEALATVP